jgi:glycosyltransferase involved in cell wall biosynthesis
LTDVTIITCTVKRPAGLKKTLDSMAEAIRNAPEMSAEVIVVDNGSTDNTQDVIAQWMKSVPFPVQSLREPRPGASFARNAGIRVAKGRILVVTDDDCCLNPDYLTVLKRYYDQDTGLVVRGGRVELGDPADLPLTIKLDDQIARMTDITFPGGFLLGCNMTMKREVIDKIGLFDERFGPGSAFNGGEDTDYLYRAFRAGIPVEYVPDMTVKHFHGRRDKATIIRLDHLYHMANGAVFAKHITDKKLLRHFYWDCKNFIRQKFYGDTASDGNSDNYALLGLTLRAVIVGNLEGMLKFWTLELRDYARKFFNPGNVQAASKLKILFITRDEHIPQRTGGLQSSADQMCRGLLSRGHKVAVLAGFMPVGLFGFWTRLKMKINKALFGYKISMDTILGYPVWRGWFPWEDVVYVAQQEKPDLIVVMASKPVRMALAAKPANIPILMKLMDVSFYDHDGDFKQLGNIPCIANSHFTADTYRKAFGVNPTVINPFIVLDKYKTPTTRENITFINPILNKGLDIALEIARRCPDIPFSFVEAWPLSVKERQYLMGKLSALPNVTLLHPQKDMRNVYGKCKILLVPSVWEEAYGRVATEAQASGIPVIASSRGGLPESVGNGGILLDPEGPIETWVEAVRKLWDDNAYYAQLSAKATAYANRPEMDIATKLTALERVLFSVCRQIKS